MSDQFNWRVSAHRSAIASIGQDWLLLVDEQDLGVKWQTVRVGTMPPVASGWVKTLKEGQRLAEEAYQANRERTDFGESVYLSMIEVYGSICASRTGKDKTFEEQEADLEREIAKCRAAFHRRVAELKAGGA